MSADVETLARFLYLGADPWESLASSFRASLMSEAADAIAERVCPILCDDDCESDCHEAHAPGFKRDWSHFDTCPGRRF